MFTLFADDICYQIPNPNQSTQFVKVRNTPGDDNTSTLTMIDGLIKFDKKIADVQKISSEGKEGETDSVTLEGSKLYSGKAYTVPLDSETWLVDVKTDANGKIISNATTPIYKMDCPGEESTAEEAPAESEGSDDEGSVGNSDSE